MYKNEDIISIENLNTSFKLKWRMTGWCNFHCSYCLDNNNRSDWISEEQIITNAKAINNLFKDKLKNKKVRLSLLGGEVCYYNLIKVIKQFKDLKISSVCITTNFSQDVDYYINLITWFNENNYHYNLMCSEHKENLDFNNKFKILSDWCKENNYILPKRSKVINSESKVLPSNQQYIFIEKNNFNKSTTALDVDMKKVVDTFESNNLKKNYKVVLKDDIVYYNTIAHFIAELDNGGLKTNNLKCTAGLDNILINWNGDIILNQCNVLKDKIIGNINDYNIILPSSLYYCDTDGYCPICNGVSIYKQKE